MTKWDRSPRHSASSVHREPERFVPPRADPAEPEALGGQPPSREGEFIGGSASLDKALRVVGTLLLVAVMWCLTLYTALILPLAMEFDLCDRPDPGALCTREGTQLGMVVTLWYAPGLAIAATHRIVKGPSRARRTAAWVWAAGLLLLWVVMLTLAYHNPADWLP